MQIVFWQNMLSYHQSAYIRALSNKKNIRVMLIVHEDIPEWRKDMGWSIPNFGNAKILIRPEKAEIFQILKETEHDSVHIFSGIRAYPLVKAAFLQSLSFNIIFSTCFITLSVSSRLVPTGILITA